ncbi:MAG: hypothetical protein HOO99_00175 [Hyphomicrobiaceae bacterium]|nr:hypothetical protein [Hyphomicrobiaceae bacterium]
MIDAPSTRANIRSIIAERPWIKPVVALAAWLVSIFGLTASGTAMLGRAVLLGSFIAAFVFGAIGLADRLSVPATASATVVDIAKSRQRSRSIAIALSLGGLVLLFYIATLVRLGGNVFNRGI